MPRPKKDSLPQLTSKGNRAVIKLGGQTFDCGPSMADAFNQKRADQLTAIWLLLGRPDFEHDSPLFLVPDSGGSPEVNHGQIALALLSVLPDALVNFWSEEDGAVQEIAAHLTSLSSSASNLAYSRCESLMRQFVLASLGKRNGNGGAKPERKRNVSGTKSERKPAPKAGAKGGAK